MIVLRTHIVPNPKKPGFWGWMNYKPGYCKVYECPCRVFFMEVTDTFFGGAYAYRKLSESDFLKMQNGL